MMCVCTFCRHCLGAEEGGGRGEGAGWAAGVKRHLCWVRCWKTGEGSRAEGEDDRWLVCLLVWECEKVSLFTFVCLANALFLATGMSCNDPPRSLFYRSTSPLQSTQEPLLCSPQQDSLILNFCPVLLFHVFQSLIPVIKNTIITTCLYMQLSNENDMVCTVYTTQILNQTNVWRLFFYLNLL